MERWAGLRGLPLSSGQCPAGWASRGAGGVLGLGDSEDAGLEPVRCPEGGASVGDGDMGVRSTRTGPRLWAARACAERTWEQTRARAAVLARPRGGVACAVATKPEERRQGRGFREEAMHLGGVWGVKKGGRRRGCRALWGQAWVTVHLQDWEVRPVFSRCRRVGSWRMTPILRGPRTALVGTEPGWLCWAGAGGASGVGWALRLSRAGTAKGRDMVLSGSGGQPFGDVGVAGPGSVRVEPVPPQVSRGFQGCGACWSWA